MGSSEVWFLVFDSFTPEVRKEHRILRNASKAHCNYNGDYVTVGNKESVEQCDIGFDNSYDVVVPAILEGFRRGNHEEAVAGMDDFAGGGDEDDFAGGDGDGDLMVEM
ncbi:hypothetical protein Droror1_Dr00007741 [Drosera rotundifolia]